MRLLYLAPVTLVALLATSCMSPPQGTDRGPAGGDRAIEELESEVRARGPIEAPPPSLIETALQARRLPPPPRDPATQPAGEPSSGAPATGGRSATPATPSGAPGSARSYIERYPQQR